MQPPPSAALSGVTVLDCATLFAGPLAAMVLGDFGADVIKIEHPSRPDPSRTHGRSKDGIGLWWKMLGRNKDAITLNLGLPPGAELFLRLAAGADVIIENFRPGTLERWGIGPEELYRVNPRLILARVTGFGQFGPYANRPGFGTLAEAMSGFAAITGEPDGPPTLPPFGLADGVAALSTTIAIMMALHSRATTGRGQVVDLAIIEPLVTLLGAQATVYDLLGDVQQRTGNRSVNNAPRNIYKTADQRWVAISTSAQSVAERVMTLVGAADLLGEDWFQSGLGRAQHADLLDSYITKWVAQRTLAEVSAAFEDAQAAVAPIYDIRDLLADPQYQALDTITTVPDPDFGSVRMQNVLFRLAATPGCIRFTGRPHGADTGTVLRNRLGLSEAEIDGLREAGVI
jgi:crotonobetainyl-CoA:carnitine CoA-transferase CaiB-like acyl-CoA transferase